MYSSMNVYEFKNLLHNVVNCDHGLVTVNVLVTAQTNKCAWWCRFFVCVCGALAQLVERVLITRRP